MLTEARMGIVSGYADVVFLATMPGVAIERRGIPFVRNRKRLLMLGLSGLALLSMFTAAFFVVTRSSQASAGGVKGVAQHAKYVGSTSLRAGAASATTASNSSTLEIRNEPEFDKDIAKSGHGALRVPADHTPMPAMNSLIVDGAAPGFNGISHRDQRLANGGNQFSLEPPDQALCVGSGFVLESINTALRVYHTDGTAAGGVIALNPFFGLAPEIIRGTHPVFGDFTSDPKCYYDVQTNRWFVTILQADVVPATGDFTGRTSVLVAVSQSNDPTGGWNIFKIDTTDDGTNGTPSHTGCPCLGDQPLIGADANGFYISTNEFPFFVDGFNGAQIYAISKSAIEAATSGSTLNITQIDAGAITTPDPGGIWYSIQPATVPGTTFASANNGTEYFMSSLQFGPGALDNRIAVWALTNTASLNTTADVALSHVVIGSEVYGQPPDSAQKDGPLFLASNMAAIAGVKTPPTEKLAFLAGNDDRMNQVVFAGGKLWSGVNTVISGNGPTRVGIAYFIVTPSDPSGALSASMAKQGYVALNQNDVLYPSIGVTDAGKGVMTFTVAGPDFFPSAGYAKIDATSGAGAVHVAKMGAEPEDGFTAYSAFGGDGTSRWGDYSAAVAVGGDVWFSCEYIPGGPRTVLANWGTFVGHVAA